MGGKKARGTPRQKQQMNNKEHRGELLPKKRYGYELKEITKLYKVKNKIEISTF